MRSFLGLLHVVTAALSIRLAASQCTVCQDGQEVSLPDQILSIPGFPPLPCGSVDTTLGFLVPNATSENCLTVQSLGSLCGCPVRADSCSLCPDGSSATIPTNELPFLSDRFGGITPSCQIFEAYLSSQAKDDALCGVSQSFIADYCGCNDSDNIFESPETAGPPCSLCPNGSSASDRNITVPNFPFSTCAQLEEALGLLLLEESEECSLLSSAFGDYCGCPVVTEQPSCSLCQDGSPIAFPDTPVSFFSLAGIVPTCEIYESLVASFDSGSEDCENAQLFGTICGCPAIENHCVFCPGEEMPESSWDRDVHELSTFREGVSATCKDVETYIQYQVPSSSQLCELGQQNNHLCGCSDGIFSYLSADTVARQAALAWVPRVSALISLIGSLFITWDVLSVKKRRQAVYSQIILGVSLFDMMGAVAWILSTWPIPKVYQTGTPSFIYGAEGNDATCTAQGFLVQLSFTAVFYNISLSAYYFLVIVYGWRERKLKSNRWWLHGVPLFIGIGLAFGGIPFYKNNIVMCHIQSPPYFEDTWYPVIFFACVPIFAAILFTTVMMGRVYWTVRQQSRKSAKWNIPTLSFRNNKGGAADASSKRLGSSFASFMSRRSSAGSSNDFGVDGGGATGKKGGSGELSVGGTAASTTRTRRSAPLTATQKLERQVFIQSALYLTAFYVTWTFLLAATIVASPVVYHQSDLFPFYIICFILAPLQGFWNACIYFRPRLLARWTKAKAAKRHALASSTHPIEWKTKKSSWAFWRSSKAEQPAFNSSICTNSEDTTPGATNEPAMDCENELAQQPAPGEAGPRIVLASPMGGIEEELAEIDGAQDQIMEYVEEVAPNTPPKRFRR